MTANVLQHSRFSARQRTFWQQERSLSCTSEIASLVEEILKALATNGFSDQDRFAVRLALEEAIVNAIKHGHGYDPEKQVQVCYAVQPERLLVEITDQGPGYDPDSVPDPLLQENLEKPSGRGLLLMRTYMTWVRLNEEGNRVTMCKACSG